MTNFQRMDIKNQEQRKVKEKVVLKDFLNKGPISSSNFHTSSPWENYQGIIISTKKYSRF